MPFLQSLKANAKVPDAWAGFVNGTQLPIIHFHQSLMRGPSDLTVRQRELIAAFVSRVNACEYCFGVHSMVAVECGVHYDLFDELIVDISRSSVEKKMKPILHFVKKLTLTPTEMTQNDAEEVYKAGWSEQALYDAVQVCCLYNFMNRFVEGLGLAPIASEFHTDGLIISREGYEALIQAFEIKAEEG